jgi:hypothetical protein
MNSFTVPAANTIQAKKFMLGVYDPVSMLNGYIDTTSPTFAVYDKNRPASDYLLNATAATSEATALLGLGGQGSRLPAKVLVGNPATTLAAGASSVGSFSVSNFVTAPKSRVSDYATVTTTSLTPNSIILLTGNIPSVLVSLGTVNLVDSSFGINVANIDDVSSSPSSTLIINWLIIN